LALIAQPCCKNTARTAGIANIVIATCATALTSGSLWSPAHAEPTLETLVAAPSPLPETVLRSLSVEHPASLPSAGQDVDVQQLKQLSMDQAVDLSVQRNPKLKSSYWTFRSSQDLLGGSYSAWWPKVSLNVGSGLYKYKSTTSGASTNYTEITSLFSSLSPPSAASSSAAGASTSTASSSFDASSISSAFESLSGQPNGNYFYSTLTLELKWDVFAPTRSLNIWKSKYQALQDSDRYTIAFRDNVLNVQSAYVDLQSFQAKNIAYQSIVENSSRLVRVSEDKKEFGIASGLDVAKQRSNYYADLSILEQSSRDIRSGKAKLAALLNIDDARQINLAVDLAPLGIWPHSLDQTVSASESHRKVVQELLLDIYLNGVNAEIEMASYLPTLQLAAQLYGTQTGYWTESYADFVQNPSAVLTFSWTGFDGGQARMRSASYRKLEKASYETYLDTLNQVKENARSGFADVDQGRAIVLASSNQVKQATISLELQTQRYEIGYGTVTDLVQAQTTLAQAVVDYINNLQDYNKSLLELARNTGLEIRKDAAFMDLVGDPLGLLQDSSLEPSRQ